MIAILCIIIFFLLLISCISIYANINVLKKQEILEINYKVLEENYSVLSKWFILFKRRIDESNSKINQIDIKGSFSSDDEIGFMFKEIKKIQGQLNEIFE